MASPNRPLAGMQITRFFEVRIGGATDSLLLSRPTSADLVSSQIATSAPGVGGVQGTGVCDERSPNSITGSRGIFDHDVMMGDTIF